MEEKRQVLGRVVTIDTLYLTVNIYYCCDYLPLLHCVNLVLLCTTFGCDFLAKHLAKLADKAALELRGCNVFYEKP